jgi:YD repeat-containing protein
LNDVAQFWLGTETAVINLPLNHTYFILLASNFIVGATAATFTSCYDDVYLNGVLTNWDTFYDPNNGYYGSYWAMLITLQQKHNFFSQPPINDHYTMPPSTDEQQSMLTASAGNTTELVPPITWAIVGSAYGCTIDSQTGLVIAGKTNGTITVRGTDAVGCQVDDVLDIKCGGGSCGCGYGTQAGLHSLDVSIDLGWATNGGTAGQLTIHQDTPSSLLATPASLQYNFLRNDVQVISNSLGIRQVMAEEVLADVVTNNPESYSINVYFASNVLGFSNGLFQTVNSPFKTVTIEEIGNSTNQIQVTDDNQGSVMTYDYNWIGNGWTLASGTGLRMQTNIVVWSESNTIRAVTNIVSQGTGAAVYQKAQVFQEFPAGERLLNQWIGNGPNKLTSSYTYYTNGFLQESILSDGSWQYIIYDNYNRPVSIFSPFGNSPLTTNASLCRMISNIYSPSVVAGSGDTGAQDFATPRCSIVYVLGQEVSRTYNVILQFQKQEIKCVTPGAAWNAADNLVTTTTYISGGLHTAEVQSEMRPDGTVTLYQYGSNPANMTNVVMIGHPNTNGTSIDQGTITTSIYGSHGQLLSKQVIDAASMIVTSFETYQYDALNRRISTTYLDGTASLVNYDCCTIGSSQDRDGTITTYGYDALKRLLTTTLNGVTVSNIYDANDDVVGTVRYGTDGAAITTTLSAYDTAGRLIASTDGLNNTTQYQCHPVKTC